MLQRRGHRGVSPVVVDLVESDLDSVPWPVGAVRGHGFDDVGYGDDACAYKDLFALEAPRVAGAVHPLVVLADHLGHRPGEVDAGDDVVSGLGVLLDEFELGSGQLAGPAQDLRGDRDLADVVDGGCRRMPSTAEGSRPISSPMTAAMSATRRWCPAV